MATPSPETAPNNTGRLIKGVRASSSTTTAGPRYSAKKLIGAPSAGPTTSATIPLMATAKSAAAMADPGPNVIRTATRANAAAPAIIMGCRTSRNCSTPKSYSIWKTDRPMMSPPNAMHRVSQLPHPSAGAFSPIAARPSRSSNTTAISDNPAPPINIRWVGPHRVTSWPNMRCQMSSRGKPTSA